MKTLFLLRHADASARIPEQDDIDRHLSERGRSEAAGLPVRFSQHAAPPTLVICSSAQRAVQTLDALRASPSWPGTAQVEIEPSLYLAGTEALHERLSWIEDEADRVLLVAHNPGIALLALNLAESRDTAASVRLRDGFPPAALAVLEFDIERWMDVETRTGRLIDASAP